MMKYCQVPFFQRILSKIWTLTYKSLDELNFPGLEIKMLKSHGESFPDSPWMWISSLEYKHEEDEQKEMKTEYAEEEEQDIPY